MCRIDSVARSADHIRLGQFVMGLGCLLLSGCYSLIGVNQSGVVKIIKVASLSGEPGLPTTTLYKAAEIGLQPNEVDSGKFTLLPYSVTAPGNQYALLQADAGNGRLERAFVPFTSTTTATVAPDGSLDLAILPIPSDSQLRDELTARLPGLSDALLLNDTRAIAAILLNWAANNIDDALLAADSKTSTTAVVQNNVAYSYHELFRRDRGAVFCGGFAVMYQKLLLAFDIDALIIDFGDPVSGLTHMSVVVPDQDALGNWRFFQFDPKLNFRCADVATGDLVSVFEVMDRELAGKFDTVQILQGNNDKRDFVGSSGSNGSVYKLDRVKGSRYIYHRAGYTLQTHVTDYRSAFVGGGFTPGIAGFFELMQKQFYTVRMGNNSVSREAFVQELSKRKIPLIYPKYKWPQ